MIVKLCGTKTLQNNFLTNRRSWLWPSCGVHLDAYSCNRVLVPNPCASFGPCSKHRSRSEGSSEERSWFPFGLSHRPENRSNRLSSLPPKFDLPCPFGNHVTVHRDIQLKGPHHGQRDEGTTPQLLPPFHEHVVLLCHLQDSNAAGYNRETCCPRHGHQRKPTTWTTPDILSLHRTLHRLCARWLEAILSKITMGMWRFPPTTIGENMTMSVKVMWSDMSQIVDTTWKMFVQRTCVPVTLVRVRRC